MKVFDNLGNEVELSTINDLNNSIVLSQEEISIGTFIAPKNRKFNGACVFMVNDDMYVHFSRMYFNLCYDDYIQINYKGVNIRKIINGATKIIIVWI